MVNEKIEGFYDVCKVVGLTGRQGVCIPESNVRNLVIRNDVRQAINNGIFHIFPIKTIEQGMELLSGIKAGALDEKKTLHWLINKRLNEMAQSFRHFGLLSRLKEAPQAVQKTKTPQHTKTPEDQP